jgi:hypothetical protein
VNSARLVTKTFQISDNRSRSYANLVCGLSLSRRFSFHCGELKQILRGLAMLFLPAVSGDIRTRSGGGVGWSNTEKQRKKSRGQRGKARGRRARALSKNRDTYLPTDRLSAGA